MKLWRVGFGQFGPVCDHGLIAKYVRASCIQHVDVWARAFVGPYDRYSITEVAE